MLAPDRRLADGVLLLGALAGALLVAWLLPATHPLGAASWALGPDGAEREAQAFLARRGFDVPPGGARRARFVAQGALLDSLQADLGRAEATRRLVDEAALPAFGWEIRYAAPGEAGPQSAPDRFVLHLDDRGRPWAFRNAGGVVPHDGVDRGALEQALALGEPLGGLRLDSALAARLVFDLPADGAAPAAGEAGRARREADRRRLFAAAAGPVRGLGAETAAAFARAHLAGTLLAAWPLDVRAVTPLSERGRAAARVRFVSRAPVDGQGVVADVDVTAAGALLGLATRFNRPGQGEAEIEEERSGWSLEVLGSTTSVVRAVAFVGLVLVLLVLFARRIRLRALDTQAALADALVAGALAALANATLLPLYEEQLNLSAWQALVMVAVNSLFWAVGVGLLVFMATAVSDSLARAAWPTRITTLTLLRQGAWLNRPVGAALVRGVALGLVLAGVTVAGLALLDGVPLTFTNYVPLFGTQFTVSALGRALTEAGWVAMVLVPVLVLAVGSALARRGGAGLVVGGMGVAFALVRWSPLAPALDGPAAWAVAGAVGLAVGLALWRYDALTVGVGLLAALLLGATAEGWLVGASPARLDAALAVGLLVATAAFGAAGVRRGGVPEAAARYVPAYLTELAERERLAHELTLAREVQRSFLPASMPEVDGLDLAAVCLPAEDVGGDYYDVVDLGEGRLGLVIGDVSGKGLQAAFYMTLIKGSLQAIWQETARPSAVLTRLNRVFCANAPRGVFVSMICAVFDTRARTLTFARAGHNPLLARRAAAGADGGAREAEPLQPPGFAIGLVGDDRFAATLRDVTLELAEGDTFVFYTDGFSEAMDDRRTLYGDDRLVGAVGLAEARAAASLLGALVAEVRTFAGGAEQHDDMTMVVARVVAPEAPRADDAAPDAALPEAAAPAHPASAGAA